ncbi:MAG: hypothetical protein ACYS0I_22350, partial [Planctomycetota bacterium]
CLTGVSGLCHLCRYVFLDDFIKDPCCFTDVLFTPDYPFSFVESTFLISIPPVSDARDISAIYTGFEKFSDYLRSYH